MSSSKPPSKRTARTTASASAAQGARRKQPWLELFVTVPFEYVEPIAALFQRHGKGGAVIEEVASYSPDEGEPRPTPEEATLRTYLPQSSRYRRSRELLHIGVNLVSQLAGTQPLQEREVHQDEWEGAWKAHFMPLRVGRRIVVTPPWARHEQHGGDLTVEIDPGLAFGTGHHPTTRRVLECIEQRVAQGMRVADIGAGSGILSIAAAQLGAGAVVALELDAVAVRAARRNVRANAVDAVVRVHLGTLPHERIAAGAADVVVANISGAVLVALAEPLRDALRPSGVLIGSGILASRWEEVEAAFARAHLRLVETHTDGDWVTVVYRKP